MESTDRPKNKKMDTGVVNGRHKHNCFTDCL